MLRSWSQYHVLVPSMLFDCDSVAVPFRGLLDTFAHARSLALDLHEPRPVQREERGATCEDVTLKILQRIFCGPARRNRSPRVVSIQRQGSTNHRMRKSG